MCGIFGIIFNYSVEGNMVFNHIPIEFTASERSCEKGAVIR